MDTCKNEDVVVDSLWRNVQNAVKVADAATPGSSGGDGEVAEISSDSESGSGNDMGIQDEAGLPVGPACPSHSEPATGGAHPRPQEAQRSEDWAISTRASRPLAAREDWVISTRACRPLAARLVPWSIWKGQKEKDIVAGLPPREKALMWHSRIFGGDALTNTELDEGSLRPYVELVFDEFQGKLWPLTEDAIAKSLRDVPPEALCEISCEEFVAEYHRLRCWLGAMRKSSFGREVLALSRCRVAKHCCVSGLWQKGFWVDVASVVEATDHTYIPAAGASVHVKGQGRCKVLEVETRVCNTRLHRFIMSTRYEEIHALQVWHVVRAYHRCTLLAVPSESIAESVGSVVGDAAGQGSGRPKDITSFIRATTVRMCRLRGHGDEEGILADALNTHFNGQGPECWHMRRRRRDSVHPDGAAMTRAILERRMRLQHCPPWVSSPLCDVARRGEQVYCKRLPRPQDFSALATGGAIRKGNLSAPGDTQGVGSSAKRARGAESSTATARRESLHAAKSEATPSTLSETLWSMLKISSFSIAHTHRPGKSFR